VLHIKASDAENDPISFEVTSSDPSAVSVSLQTGPFLEMVIESRPSGQPAVSLGRLVIQLFPDLAPNTVARIQSLVESGFYNDVIFHRVIPNFVIQTGDPEPDNLLVNGTGVEFNDEFNTQLIFSGDGQLAMANRGKDTNDSQFFVTIGEQRGLDFNHTIFGQLVRGFDVRDAISTVDTDADNRPTTDIVIASASIIQNQSDAVILIRSTSDSAAATITVRATDSNNESSTEDFLVTSFTDLTNDPPILGPVTNKVTQANTPLTFTLSGTDLEGDALEFKAEVLNTPAQAAVRVNGNQVTVTPVTGFVGTIDLLVGVRQQGATSRGTTADPFDTQRITVTVEPLPPPPPDPRTPNERFVDEMYEQLLGRAPDALGRAGFTHLLNAGMPRQGAVLMMQTSHEYRVRLVQEMYNDLLGRDPDPLAWNVAVGFLTLGGRPEKLRALIMGSAEYLRQNSLSSGGFLGAVYLDIFGRPIDPLGQATYAPLLEAGAPRPLLVELLLRSREAQEQFVQGLYLEHLQRPADPVGLDVHADHLAAGVREEFLVAGVLGSDEFFQSL
jgi:cyclophilin family peptidyl-prolyl cis-trans isomerase